MVVFCVCCSTNRSNRCHLWIIYAVSSENVSMRATALYLSNNLIIVCWVKALPTLHREDKASWWEPNAHPIPLQVSSTLHPQTGETKACRKSRCNNCWFQARSCQGRKQGSGPKGACNWFSVHHLRLPPDDHENQAGVDHLVQLGLILFWVMGTHSFVFGVQILSRKHVSRRNAKNAQQKIDWLLGICQKCGTITTDHAGNWLLGLICQK